jgi:hypothetical protein
VAQKQLRWNSTDLNSNLHQQAPYIDARGEIQEPDDMNADRAVDRVMDDEVTQTVDRVMDDEVTQTVNRVTDDEVTQTAKQVMDDELKQAGDTFINGMANMAYDNPPEHGGQKSALPDPEIHRSRHVASPWEQPFHALTDFEQAMHKLYGKYGAECDERLRRPAFGLCSRYLQNLCPACFGGTVFGKSEARYITLVHHNFTY